MPKNSLNVSLKGADDIFSTEESRQEQQREQVQQIPIGELFPFKNHPFKVLDDESMQRTVESVEQYGVLSPLIARPRPEGGYEIISGHRRQHAAQLAGLDTLPVIVRNMDDDAAVLLMVDSNLQRENILPSERVFAYKMKLEALKNQGARSDLTSDQVGQKLWSVEQVASDAGESKTQIQRFIRLTSLIPELLDMVDEKKISFNPAVELSYLDEAQQRDFLEAMKDTQNAPSLSQAQRLKKLAQEGHFSYDVAFAVMGEEKKDELDKAVKMVAELDESFEDNFVRKHVIEESQRLESEGVDAASAWKQASYRLFGDPPGAHGAGVSALLAARNWENIDDIAQVYVRWGGHVYGEGEKGAYRPDLFTQRMSKLEITLSNIDNRESNLLNSDDYNSYRGGMIAAVRSIKGEMPKNYCSDSSDRQHVVIRTLDEEVKRLFRGEAINPKYINGMKEFGYKGAGDLATYVDHCFQWDATSDVMEDWMYEKFAEKYALDKDMQDWFNQVNPWALQRIAAVLLEAEQRNLWDAKPETKAELQKLYLSMEGELEELSDKISE